MQPGDYTWLTVLGFLAAWVQAFGTGANGAANAFAACVASRALTLRQACCIALVTEFGGALLLGQMTARTMRCLLDGETVTERPDTLVLSTTCALVGSAIWLIFTSFRGWPVSSSQATIGALLGSTTTAFGMGSVRWLSWDRGLIKIVLAWLISPFIAGVVGATVFTVNKHLVLTRSEPYEYAKKLLSLLAFVAASLEIYLILTKIIHSEDHYQDIATAVAISITCAGVLALWAHYFFIPFLARIIEGESHLRWWNACWMPRPKHCQRHRGANSQDQTRRYFSAASNVSASSAASSSGAAHDSPATNASATQGSGSPLVLSSIHVDSPCVVSDAGSSMNELSRGYTAVRLAKRAAQSLRAAALHGPSKDVLGFRAERLQHLHNFARRYDVRTEQLYSYLQVFTAMCSSCAHASNDVANAIGPLSIIWHIHTIGKWDQHSSHQDVPPALLAYGGAAMALGFVTYGFKVMRSLGNHFTYHSPSRGFSMELSSSLTVLTACELGIPVSTTHCMVGATAGVGLCNGSVNAINWRLIARALGSWILTVPATGLLSAALTALCLYSPKK